jgi:hypothetical protein
MAYYFWLGAEAEKHHIYSPEALAEMAAWLSSRRNPAEL